uniref:HECT-type E3 ubiquitin transferase n=1 Tax=Astyanax mexicanus TaxID=7994 RepID=A0A8B9KPI5_ASTMX
MFDVTLNIIKHILIIESHHFCFSVFLTGFDRVPVLGMNQVKMRVCPRLPSTQDHLPEALTCHSLLELPVYNTKETLQAKLTEALQHKRGFWDD